MIAQNITHKGMIAPNLNQKDMVALNSCSIETYQNNQI